MVAKSTFPTQLRNTQSVSWVDNSPEHKIVCKQSWLLAVERRFATYKPMDYSHLRRSRDKPITFPLKGLARLRLQGFPTASVTRRQTRPVPERVGRFPPTNDCCVCARGARSAAPVMINALCPTSSAISLHDCRCATPLSIFRFHLSDCLTLRRRACNT